MKLATQPNRAVQQKQQDFLERQAVAASRDWREMEALWWRFASRAHEVTSKLGGKSFHEYSILLHEHGVNLSEKRLYDLVRVYELFKDSDPSFREVDRSLLVASTRIHDKEKREELVMQAQSEKRSVNWMRAAAKGIVLKGTTGYTGATVRFYQEKWGAVKTEFQRLMGEGTINGYDPIKPLKKS